MVTIVVSVTVSSPVPLHGALLLHPDDWILAVQRDRRLKRIDIARRDQPAQVGIPGDVPVVAVQHHVMEPAQTDPVVEVGRALVPVPRLNVVGLSKLGTFAAAGPGASAPRHRKGQPLDVREETLGATEIKDSTVGVHPDLDGVIGAQCPLGNFDG